MQTAIKVLRCARQFQSDTGDKSQPRNFRIPSGVQCKSQEVSVSGGVDKHLWALPNTVGTGWLGANLPGLLCVLCWGSSSWLGSPGRAVLEPAGHRREQW